MKMRLLTAALAVACICLNASAETYRFDMGGAHSPVATGYTQVLPDTMLEANPAYGWASRTSMIVHRNEPTNPYYAERESLEYTLYSDGVLTVGENTFSFEVEPGRYRVTAIIGDLALGEERPGNSIWANDELIVADEGTNASVKAYGFAVDAAGGTIALRFRADSLQRYSTVIGVTAEPLAAGEAVELSVEEYPEEPVTRETYLLNWQLLQDDLVADWELAKGELAAEGADLAYWETQAAALKERDDYREYWGWSLGGGTWERMAVQTGRLDIGQICSGFGEMGIDGFGSNSPVVTEQLIANGFGHSVSGGGENFPQPDMTGITLNLMANRDGSRQTMERVYCNVAPEVIAAFQDVWNARLSEVAPDASFFLIDEPRGMWYSGRFGDYSDAAQEVFRSWAAERGYEELATSGIPERGRNLDFYRFYQFRLQSVAYLVKSFIQDTPVEDVPTAPGNGNIGPEQMNHNGYWPPAIAEAGLISSCWAYGEPASCKMYAETVAMAREFGGQSMIVPPLYPGAHTPRQAIPMHVACISAMTTRVNPWHFRGPVNGPDRPQWMKSVYYSARLTHATSGLVHEPGLYVWCPESLVYNDLVEMNGAEAGHWAETWRALYDANLDYAVTNTLEIPADSVVLYSCARPVLNEEEYGRLQEFVAGGGTVLCTFADTPESPDGVEWVGWDELPAARVMPVELTPEAVRERAGALGVDRNWETGAAGVKTYAFTRGETVVHLLNNTDFEEEATVVLPVATRDLLTGETLAAGDELILGPGLYALLEQ